MRKLTVLLLCRYGPMAASTRHRLLQYLPYLTEQGFDIHVETLLDDLYLQRLYSGQRVPVGRIARAYADRVTTLVRAQRYDLIWTYIEAFPWFPGWLESRLLPRGIPYVVDYDDAMFHRYDRHRRPLVRKLLATKIDRVMREAALVVAGNQYIADRAVQAGARQVEILPTVIDLNRYPASPLPQNDEFTVGWIGSPATAYNLQVVRPALERFCRIRRARLATVGSGNVELGGVPVEVRPWTEQSEVQAIQGFDVGIMPLVDSPFERGKNGFKLVQYMACSRPVIGSPVGVNREIIADGVNGFLATTTDQWLLALDTLYVDAVLRERQGKAGRHLVEERYALQVTAPRLGCLLSDAAEGGSITG